jgi:hypothetical protein
VLTNKKTGLTAGFLLSMKTSSKVLLSKFPVHQIREEGLNELGAHVAVVDVVGVFPYVHGEQGFVCGGEGRAGCAGVDDVNAAVWLFHEPCPAGAEVAYCAFHEGFFEGGVAAEFGVDGCGQCAGWLAAAGWLHAAPKEGVIPDLGAVVVDAAGAALDDVFQALAFKLGAFLQVVEVDDVGIVVLAVVVFEGFFAVVRCERVNRVRQGG